MNYAVLAKDADIIGDVSLNQEVSVWYHAVIRGDLDKIEIGRGSNIQDLCVLHADEGSPIKIGEYVTVGHGAIIHGCEIGDNSLIGMGAIVLNGAKIGKNCIIGAGALVTQNKVIPDGSLAFGNPAKIVRSITNDEISENRKSADEYIKLSENLNN